MRFVHSSFTRTHTFRLNEPSLLRTISDKNDDVSSGRREYGKDALVSKHGWRKKKDWRRTGLEGRRTRLCLLPLMPRLYAIGFTGFLRRLP